MQLLFREKRADEVEQEVTQRDQFNSDEVSLVAAVSREADQNSLDAKANGSTHPVRVSMRFVAPSPANRSFFDSLFSGLEPHLQASEIDTSGLDLSSPSFLVIEDYQTTGLLGKWDDPDDDGPFNDFWRRVGKSHKEGSKGGRWGLGKLVFSSASRARTFFGLTVRDGDPSCQPLLMGQVVLATHKVDGKKFAPHGFFAIQGRDGLQLPVTDRVFISEFSRATGIQRTSEPGLSIVIPFVLDEIRKEELVPEVIRNYFFPILTGKLEVDVDGDLISASTFDAVAAKYASGSSTTDPDLIEFIRSIHAAKDQAPAVLLQPSWTREITDSLPPETVEDLRKKFNVSGDLVHVRVPILLKRKHGTEERTYFDLFLQKAPERKRGEALYVRSAITVPDEARYFRARQVFGALVASDPAIASFLGDAENPAHTRWNGAAEKLDKNWKAGKARLSEIRNSLNRLYDALSQALEVKEPDALIDVFSIPDTTAGGNRRRRNRPPVIPNIKPSPKVYRILERKGGFSIAAGPGLTSEKLPIQIRVRAAYDVLRGNPFKKYNPLDFDMTKDDIEIAETGATVARSGSNEIAIDIADVDFRVDLDGFDQHRDLMVRTSR
jgi:hypothetical protein